MFIRTLTWTLMLVGLVPVVADARPVSEMQRLIPDPTYSLPSPHLAPPTMASQTPHWIWLGPVVGDQRFHARTTLTLRSRPRTARVWITGDDAFTLYINGRRVDGTQPVEQGWSHPHREDVTPDLHPGRNVVAVVGINRSGGAAGILVELDVDGVPALVSDSHWKAVLSTAPPAGWLKAPFDDAGWQNATDEGAIGTGVWGSNVSGWLSADARYMAHQVRRPVAVESLSGPGTSQGLASLQRVSDTAHAVIRPGRTAPRQILLDFGTELSGRIELAGTAGARVDVHTGESRAACLRVLKEPRLISIDNSGPWMLTLQGKDVQTTPYTAFRYALLTFPDDRPVTLTRADCDFKYYPVKYQGSFSCSDPLLTRIWYAGAYTAHLCMQEDIWDAPKRDRGLWIGDLHVTGETINNVFADRFLMEKTLAGGRAAAQNGRPDMEMPTADINNIPGYTASWFGALADFYRHVGDTAFLRRQHRNILTLLAFQQAEFDRRGLFVNPRHEWDFCDWAPDYAQGTPQTLATTDLFDIYGVRQAVFLLRALHDKKNAEKYAAWADTLTQGARTLLTDPQTQTYGRRLQENAMAVYADVATPEQAAAIYGTVLQAGSPAWTVPSGSDLAGSEVMSPFGGNYVLRAYAKLGRYQAGIDLLRRYWGAMLARGTTTLWECFDPSLPTNMNQILAKMPYLSLSHGWSSGPTSFLTECILGVQPTAGGFDRVVIQPELGDLNWADGTVPTPHGVLRLHVKKTNTGLACTLTLPRGIHALVNLPNRTIRLDHAGRFKSRS